MMMAPSARFSLWYRAPLVVLFVAVAGAVGPAGLALAEATVASPSSGEPCQIKEMDVSTPPNPITPAFAPGQVSTEQVSLHNGTSADFTDAYFEFWLTPVPNANVNATTIAPSVSWSIDGSKSPGMTFRWFSNSAPEDSFWRSDDTALPALAAESTHTLQFQASFHADSPAGWYDVDLVITSQACHGAPLAETTLIAFVYETAYGRGGYGSHGTPAPGQVGTGKPASVPPTAPVSPTPGAPSASPSATESINPSRTATLSPTTNESASASTKGPPKIAWLGGLLLLAVAALLSVRYRKS